MPKYVIEREIPDAGNLSKQDLIAISQNFHLFFVPVLPD